MSPPVSTRYFTIFLCHILWAGEGPTGDRGAVAAINRALEEQLVEPGKVQPEQTLAGPEASMGDGDGSDRWQELRMRVIELGIQVLWGKSAFPATMAADVPIMSGAWRMGWIRLLGAVGVEKFG